MNVVDSSGWLEYLANGPNAGHFAAAVEQVEDLIVPTISVYEVFKRMSLDRGKAAAFAAAGLMYQGEVVPLNGLLAIDAAYLSRQLALPMAAASSSRQPMRTARPCGLKTKTSRRSKASNTSRSSTSRLRGRVLRRAAGAFVAQPLREQLTSLFRHTQATKRVVRHF